MTSRSAVAAIPGVGGRAAALPLVHGRIRSRPPRTRPHTRRGTCGCPAAQVAPRGASARGRGRPTATSQLAGDTPPHAAAR
eukprot:365254-Chlamydomonas_euryale.AAC.12